MLPYVKKIKAYRAAGAGEQADVDMLWAEAFYATIYRRVWQSTEAVKTLLKTLLKSAAEA
jgi:hypothetical protein